MSRARRIYLFLRDYIQELPIAWSLARMHDCERNGGHRWRWTKPQQGMYIIGSQERECTRCGCSEWIPTTHTTGSSAGSYTIHQG